MNSAYIALGGNIGDVRASIQLSLQQLTDLPIIEVIESSPLYLNAAVGGPVGQPDFLNCVASVRTTLGPDELLGRCLAIERGLGRERFERWGPRVIDIDVVLYGNVVHKSEHCETPHPRLRERPFVLVPMLDVAPPDLALPPDGNKLIDVALSALANEGITLEEYRKKRV